MTKKQKKIPKPVINDPSTTSTDKEKKRVVSDKEAKVFKKIRNAPNKEAEASKKKKQNDFPGREDAFGSLFLADNDLLTWVNGHLRIKLCLSQADSLRSKAEILELRTKMEIRRYRDQANAFDRAGKDHRESNANFVLKLSERYNLDFNDGNIGLDDVTGKINLIDPEKGFPWTKK